MDGAGGHRGIPGKARFHAYETGLAKNFNPLAVLDPRLPQFTEKSLFFRFYHGCDPRMDGSFREMLISEHLSVLAGRISRLISDET